MSKHRLVVEEEYEFLSFGLSCHQKDFRIAWFLNQLLRFDFKRTQIEMFDKNGSLHFYPMFRHHDSQHHLNYLLLNNLSDSIPLIKQYKQFNMFVLVEGYIDLFDEDSFMNKLQQMESIQFLSPIENKPFNELQFTLFEY